MKINCVYKVKVHDADYELEIKFESELLGITESDCYDTVLRFANGVELAYSCIARVVLGEVDENVLDQ